MKSFKYTFICICLLSCSTDDFNENVLPKQDDQNKIVYHINPSEDNFYISDLIYGIGYYGNENVVFNSSTTFIRFGGNNTSPYNWEINCSNAGKDWYHNSYVYDSKNLGKEPAAIWRKIVENAQKSGKVPFLNLPMLYNVAGDDAGPVENDNDKHRWKNLIPNKNKPFSSNPDVNDEYVYLDEGVNFLTELYGKGKIKYSLDNEPDLWEETHSRALRAYGYSENKKTSCDELMLRTFACAKAIKNVDEQAELFGLVSYGFNGYLSFQDAPDWKSTYKNKYAWFIDYYLDSNHKESINYGKRLVDVLDIHMYPSEKGDNPIIKREVKSTIKDMKVRMQAPRRLWDPDYASTYDPNINQWDKWVIDYHSKFLPLLPKINQSIQTYDRDMKLAITEFQMGGYGDISGTIALVDVLGILGKYGVYAANHWDSPGYNGFLAYDIFRDYDGQGSSFGNTHVKAEVKDFKFNKLQTSIYASINDYDPSKLHLIVLNKNIDKDIKGEFVIDGLDNTYSNVTGYLIKGVDDTSREQGEKEFIDKINDNIVIKDNVFVYSIPRLSVVHFIIEK